MKRWIGYGIALLLCGCASKNAVVEQHGKDTVAEQISIGVVDSVYSPTLREWRKIWVYVPNSFKYSVFNGQQHYPVVYLLDGKQHFHAFTGILEHLSEENGNMICPDMIVVGVLNTNRTRDLTPSADTSTYHESGGGEQFSTFLEKELIPHIDSVYHPAPFRTLVGHSYGGLTVVNMLLHHRDSFNAFVAIDPSLSWDNQRLLKQAAAKLKTTDFQQKQLFLGVANTMSTDMTLKHIMQDTSADNVHIRSIFTFIEYLGDMPGKSLRWDYNYYENEDHYSVPIRVEYDALHFIFRDYAFTAYHTLFDKSISDDSAVALVKAHFNYVSDKLGATMLPSEHFLNAVAGMFSNEHMRSRAETFYRLNTTYYPASTNTYKELGDFYAANKDSAKARACYEKCRTPQNDN